MKLRLASACALTVALCLVSRAQGQTTKPAADSVPVVQFSVPSDEQAIRKIPELWNAACDAGHASEVSAL